MKKLWAIFDGGAIASYAKTKKDAEALCRMYNKYDTMLENNYHVGRKATHADPSVAVLSPEIGIMFHVGLDENGKISNVFVVTHFLIVQEKIIADRVLPWNGGENALHVCTYAASKEKAIEKAQILFSEYVQYVDKLFDLLKQLRNERLAVGIVKNFELHIGVLSACNFNNAIEIIRKSCADGTMADYYMDSAEFKMPLLLGDNKALFVEALNSPKSSLGVAHIELPNQQIDTDRMKAIFDDSE